MAKVPVIKTVNLTKQFMLGKTEVTALAGVNIEIYSGELVALFGPSGCGKSTLMSMVAGLQGPSSGKVLIRGENLAELDKNQLAKHRRSKIGMIFQSFNLISTMNVVENIALPLSFAAIPKKQRTQRALNLLQTVGMGKYKDHTPAELSGGQMQRIAIARSLVTNPWIILADEPTGNLDSKSANDIMRLLISLNKKSKRTVVLITHNPDYLDYVDRVFYLRDGKVVKIKVNPKAKEKNLDQLEEELASKDDPTDITSQEDKKEQFAKEEVEKLAKEAEKEGEIIEEISEEAPEEEKEEKKTKKSAKEKENQEDELPEANLENLEEPGEDKKNEGLKPISLKGEKK